MSEVELARIDQISDDDATLDVVFVHGLGGDALSTWHPTGKPDLFWPRWLAQDHPTTRVWSLGYPAAPTQWQAFATEMGILERSRNVLQYLTVAGLGDLPIVFIAHSLGGLLVKQLLRTAATMNHPEWTSLLSKARGVLFLATPHTGSSLASAFSLGATALRPSKLTKELQSGSAYLQDLGDWFRQNANELHLRIGAYYESKLTRGVAIVVDATSANPGVTGCVPVPVDGDHFSMCKPSTKASLMYRSAERFVGNLAFRRKWRVYCVPGYSGFDRELRTTLSESEIWPVDHLVEEGPLRLMISLQRNSLDDYYAHLFIVNLQTLAKQDESQIFGTLEVLQLAREQGRELSQKPIIVLYGDDADRNAVFSKMRPSEQRALEQYFRFASTGADQCSEAELRRLHKLFLQEWLVRPLSSLSPL